MSPVAIWEIFSGTERGVYDTEAVSVQKGIQEDSVGLGSKRRAAFEAGRIYIFPDLDRQMTFSPLNLDKMCEE